MSRKQVQEVIAALSSRSLRAVCPHEGCDFAMSDAQLFYRKEFTPEARELYDARVLEQDERLASLKGMLAKAKLSSGRGARAVNIGFMVERLVPCLTGFPCGHQDCRQLGEPVDYISFNGASCSGKVDSLSFIEVKTGRARVSMGQRAIKRAIEAGRVEFEVYTKEARS